VGRESILFLNIVTKLVGVTVAQQLRYPGVRLSTLGELFKFAQCIDSKREIEWNIESKINAQDVTSTRSVDDFVTLQHKEFVNSGYKLSKITVSHL